MTPISVGEAKQIHEDQNGFLLTWESVGGDSTSCGQSRNCSLLVAVRTKKTLYFFILFGHYPTSVHFPSVSLGHTLIKPRTKNPKSRVHREAELNTEQAFNGG